MQVPKGTFDVLGDDALAREALERYGTGVTGSREQLPADSPFLELVYFTDEELSRMRAGSLDNQDAVVGIYNKIKAAAGA